MEKSLEQQLEELTVQNAYLEHENRLFERYIQHHGKDVSLNDDDIVDKKGKRVKQRSKVLKLDQKIEIANTELEVIQQEVEKAKKMGEKVFDSLQGIMEETDLRIAELKKDAYEFKRDIVVGAENVRTGVIMAEKVIRYMEDKLRQRDSTIEKLTLKNGNLKTQVHKIESQLRQKEDMGDVLHYIDFHQLQIENKQHMARIEEKNEELLKLKVTSSNTMQALNNLKHDLGVMVEETERLTREIASRKDLTSKLRDENTRVTNDVKAESLAIKRFQTQINDEPTEMPQTLDYVAQKSKMFDLQQAMKDWTRKVEIAELAAKRAKAVADKR